MFIRQLPSSENTELDIQLNELYLYIQSELDERAKCTFYEEEYLAEGDHGDYEKVMFGFLTGVLNHNCHSFQDEELFHDFLCSLLPPSSSPFLVGKNDNEY